MHDFGPRNGSLRHLKAREKQTQIQIDANTGNVNTKTCPVSLEETAHRVLPGLKKKGEKKPQTGKKDEGAAAATSAEAMRRVTAGQPAALCLQWGNPCCYPTAHSECDAGAAASAASPLVILPLSWQLSHCLPRAQRRCGDEEEQQQPGMLGVWGHDDPPSHRDCRPLPESSRNCQRSRKGESPAKPKCETILYGALIQCLKKIYIALFCPEHS